MKRTLKHGQNSEQQQAAKNQITAKLKAVLGVHFAHYHTAKFLLMSFRAKPMTHRSANANEQPTRKWRLLASGGIRFPYQKNNRLCPAQNGHFMKKLYVTDLDGTFLDENEKISQTSENIISPLIKEGLNFTVASSRTPATAINLLRPLGINLPVVLMGGAMLFDIEKNITIHTNSLPQSAVEDICDMLEIVGQNALAYTVINGKLCVYYKRFENDIEREFVKSREGTPFKEFRQIEDYFDALENKDVIMFLFCMKDLRKIYTFYELLSAIPGLFCQLYPCEQKSEGYILEIYKEGMGKGEAVLNLKKQLGIETLVVFGDNFNDISMFEIANEAYAVKNAASALKTIATAVIGSNKENSVAKFIEQDFQKNKF